MSWIGRRPYAPLPLTALVPSSCAVFRLEQSRLEGALQYFIRIPKTYNIFLWQWLHLAVFSPSLCG